MYFKFLLTVGIVQYKTQMVVSQRRYDMRVSPYL